ESLSGWRRARASELEGLHLLRQPGADLAAEIEAAREPWAAVLAFAALTDLVARFRQVGGHEAWQRLPEEQTRAEAIRELLERGQEHGLTLTATTGRALGALLAVP